MQTIDELEKQKEMLAEMDTEELRDKVLEYSTKLEEGTLSNSTARAFILAAKARLETLRKATREA
jgi:hypothetical protein